MGGVVDEQICLFVLKFACVDCCFEYSFSSHYGW